MITISYMKPNFISVFSDQQPLALHGANRITFNDGATLTDINSGFTINGPQFHLIQLLFFLSVRIRHPHLRMEFHE